MIGWSDTCAAVPLVFIVQAGATPNVGVLS